MGVLFSGVGWYGTGMGRERERSRLRLLGGLLEYFPSLCVHMRKGRPTHTLKEVDRQHSNTTINYLCWKHLP